MMPKGNIQVDLDMDAFEEIARQGLRDALRKGMDGSCPFCGEHIVLKTPVTACPHYGKSFRPQVEGL